ncbi:MAG: hypothetical protein WAV30_02430 [Microgenomates group bacterium]
MRTTKKISSNPQDRFILSPSVMKYMSMMKKEFPSIGDSLKAVRTTLANDLSCLC